MTTYTGIANGDIDQDSPVTQTLMTLNRDNPIAIAEGSDDAPVVSHSWHPYDMDNVGDGADGVIWDFSVDGAGTTIETPNFADGYEYALIVEDLSTTGANATLSIALYLATGAAYDTENNITTDFDSGDALSGRINMYQPRQTWKSHAGDYTLGGLLGSSEGVVSEGFFSYDSTAQKIGKARLTCSSNFDAGKVYMLRRLDPLDF